MKQILLILVLVFGVNTIVNAQDEKIKGDRNVTIKQTYIDPFETIIVDGDFEIEIVYNSKPSVEIETDDNLHDVIQFQVTNGTLTFAETMRITSKKELRITVNYGDGLKHIETRGDSEIRSLTSMELGDTVLNVLDDSRAYLNINAKSFDFKSTGRSKSRLNLTADSTKVTLSDNSKLDALITSKVSNFDLYQRADAVIEGKTNSSQIRLSNSTNFTGKDFVVDTSDVLLEENSDLILAVTNSITISASGDSEVYLYENPKINITKLEGTSKLQKKQR